LLGTATYGMGQDSKYLLWLLAAGNIVNSMNVLPLFDIHRRQLQSALLTLASEVVGFGLILGLELGGRIDFAAVGAVYLTKWTLNLVVHVLVYHFRVRPLRCSFDAGRVRATFWSSWPLMWSTLVATIPFSTGVFFLSAAGQNEEAAMLGLGQQAAASFLLLTGAAQRYFQPRLAQVLAAGKSAWPLATAYAVFAALLLLAMIAAALLLTHFVLDARYQAAALAMTLMLMAAFVQSLGSFAGSILALRRREKSVLIAHGCGAIFFLCLGLTLTFPSAAPFALATGAAAFLSALVGGVIAWRIRAC